MTGLSLNPLRVQTTIDFQIHVSYNTGHFEALYNKTVYWATFDHFTV